MDVGSLLLKAVIGGALVVAFSLVGESIKPRRLAGIASAAPSVALASLDHRPGRFGCHGGAEPLGGDDRWTDCVRRLVSGGCVRGQQPGDSSWLDERADLCRPERPSAARGKAGVRCSACSEPHHETAGELPILIQETYKLA